MKIGTYNVYGLAGFPHEISQEHIGKPDSEKNIQYFSKTFGDLDCDILAMQEAFPTDSFRKIAQNLEQSLATQYSPVVWNGQLLTKFKILESRTFSHTAPSAQQLPFSRTGGATLIEDNQGKTFWVLNVHLHPSQMEMRVTEANIILDKLIELKKITENIIVLGDFNCTIEEDFHNILKGNGFSNVAETHGGLQPTIFCQGAKKHRTIDHIYITENFKIESCTTLNNENYLIKGPPSWTPSDHCPVIAELTLK